MLSLLSRSKEALEDDGWMVEITESYNAFTRRKRDLWSIADLLCVRGTDILAVQVTSRSNMAARRQKIAEHPHINLIRGAGVQIEVHGWDKHDGRWRCKVEDLS